MWQFVNVNMIGDAVNDAIIFMLKNEYFYDLLELDKYLLTPKELNELKQKQQDNPEAVYAKSSSSRANRLH